MGNLQTTYWQALFLFARPVWVRAGLIGKEPAQFIFWRFTMTTIVEKQLSDKLLGMAFTIHNILGPGLLEHAYEEAFCIELRRSALSFERQKIFSLHYKGELIGGYVADLVVDNKVILELKSVQAFAPVMEAQIINYLHLSKCPVGYLLNFNGTRVEWKRFAYKRE
jgi:GxxExxY protein